MNQELACLERLESHSDAVQGVQLLPAESEIGSFFTWTRTGNVRLWNQEGGLVDCRHIGLDQIHLNDEEGANELKVLRYSAELDCFIFGDRFGILKLLNRKSWGVIQELRAHSAEINDIAVYSMEGELFVTTCGRDRMVQLFRAGNDSLSLVQTMDDHVGVVNNVLFATNGARLLSASTDRTVIVRERVRHQAEGTALTAYLSQKVFTLKASPTSMALVPEQPDFLIISTMDRHIVTMKISNASTIDSFKLTDPENDDTTILSSISIGKKGNDGTPQILVGYSSTDKSVRVYDYEKKTLLTREYGHTEGISGVALLEDFGVGGTEVVGKVISTGIDGTIMIWSIRSSPPAPAVDASPGNALLLPEVNSTQGKIHPMLLPPLRKVLTKMDIVGFPTTDHDSQSVGGVSEDHQPRLQRIASQQKPAGDKAAPAEKSPVLANNASLTPCPTKSQSRSRRTSHSLSAGGDGTGGGKREQFHARGNGGSRSRRKTAICRSPSPVSGPGAAASSIKNVNRANNSRLRRPPSMPAILYHHAPTQSRRLSITHIGEVVTIDLASEEVCCILKAYRKRLLSAKQGRDLSEVEHELASTLELVKAKPVAARNITPNARATAGGGPRRSKARAATEKDINNLAVLLEKAVSLEEILTDKENDP